MRSVPPRPPQALHGTHTLPDFFPPAPLHRPQVSRRRTCSMRLPRPPQVPHTGRSAIIGTPTAGRPTPTASVGAGPPPLTAGSGDGCSPGSCGHAARCLITLRTSIRWIVGVTTTRRSAGPPDTGPGPAPPLADSATRPVQDRADLTRVQIRTRDRANRHPRNLDHLLTPAPHTGPRRAAGRRVVRVVGHASPPGLRGHGH